MRPMLERLFPKHADNAYHGSRLALWLFPLLVFLKTTISLNSIFNGGEVARGADGIPLDSFTPDGARMVITQFALWGLSQFMICLLCVVILARYRALVPLMFTVLLVEHLSRKLILQVMPIVRTGHPPGVSVNLSLLVLMVAGLTLSVWSRPRLPAGA